MQVNKCTYSTYHNPPNKYRRRLSYHKNWLPYSVPCVCTSKMLHRSKMPLPTSDFTKRPCSINVRNTLKTSQKKGKIPEIKER